MALLEQYAPWRDRERRVVKTCFLCKLLKWLSPRRHPHISDIDAHQARDIGLTPGDLAPYQHRLPSQHTHHPRG